MDWFEMKFIDKETEEYVKCVDCGKIINKKDADYSLGKNKPICISCFEFREHNNFWW